MQSATYDKIRELVRRGDLLVTLHATRELAADQILLTPLLESADNAEPIEDYPSHARGPCVLVLHRMADGSAVHAVWGLRLGTKRPAVLITAYRPDVAEWTDDLRARRR